MGGGVIKMTQRRANDMADKSIVRSLVTALNQTTGIDFEGTVVISDGV